MKIAFVDSGVGGLIFAVDMISKAKQLCDVRNFEFVHISDYSNVPYGLKSPEKLLHLTKNLLDVSCANAVNKVIVACNTACTVLTDDMQREFRQKGVEVVNIIQKSVEKSFEELADLQEINLLLLATKRTVQSKKYKDAFLEYARRINKKINLIQHYPVEWEGEVELNFANNNPDLMVQKELEHIHELMGDEKFQTINSVAMFCTHYPILEGYIRAYFSRFSRSNIRLISQGSLFADEILTKNKVLTDDTITIRSLDANKAEIKIPDVVIGYAKKLGFVLDFA